MKKLVCNHFSLTFILVISVFSCLISKDSGETKQKIFVTLRASYNPSKLEIQKKDKEEIIILLQKLVDMTIEQNFQGLPDYVDPELGIYPDLKAHWSYKRLKEELQNPNSYFEIFFFNKEKLMQEKNSSNVRTVREVILLSEGLKADLFFETEKECEVKLIFQKNSKYQGDLNNPYFIKRGNFWKVYRLF